MTLTSDTTQIPVRLEFDTFAAGFGLPTELPGWYRQNCAGDLSEYAAGV